MSDGSFPGVVARRTAAVLLLAAAVLFTPGRAVAGCGEYVTVLGRHVDQPHDPVKQPCHGPACERQPAPGELPVTSPVKFSEGGSDAAHTPYPGGPPTPSRRAIPLPSDGDPVARPTSVFHPPRPA